MHTIRMLELTYTIRPSRRYSGARGRNQFLRRINGGNLPPRHEDFDKLKVKASELDQVLNLVYKARYAPYDV